MATGAVDDCAHGKQTLVFTIVDTRAFRHFTVDMALPMNAILRCSYILQPSEHGTRVTIRAGNPTADNVFAQTMVRVMSKLQVSSARQNWTETLANLQSVIAEDLAAGAVQADTAGAIPADQLQDKIRDTIGVAAV